MAKKINPLLIIGVIVLFIFVLNQDNVGTQAIGTAGAGEGQSDPTLMNCFDYLDNDGDGFTDLEDRDCIGLGELDNDNDGFQNVVEWEQGSDPFDFNAIPILP